MLKLKRLKIEKYRNVKPGTELRFDDGVNLVLGTNGSGKTTLLGLIAAVCGLRFLALQREPFSIEFEGAYGNKHCQARIDHRAGTPQDAAFEFVVTIQEGAWTLRYSGGPSELKCEASSPTGELVKFDLPPQAFLDTSFLSMFVTSSALVDAFVPPGSPEITLDGWKQTIRTSLAQALPRHRDWTTFRFDEGLGAFYALTGQHFPSTGHNGPENIDETVVVEAAADGSPATIRGESILPLGLPVSSRFLSELLQSYPTDEIPPDHIPSKRFGLLQRVCDLLGFSRASLTLGLSSTKRLSPSSFSFGLTGFELRFYRADSTFIHHDLLSYGQRRLIAFFFYLLLSPNVVIADELVNGLHHRWIEACMAEIGDRQAFLTSQNPLLFEHVEFDSVEQVQARFITCTTEVVDGVETMVWQNMPRADAEIFYKAYQAEVEHVGDILISRGFW